MKPGRDDLTSESEPGTKAGWAALSAATPCCLVACSFSVGWACIVTKGHGPYSRTEFGQDIFDAVAPAARRWAEAIVTIAYIAIFGALLAHGFFGASTLSAALVCTGLGGLLWAWSLHHRARMEWPRATPVQVAARLAAF